MRPPQELQELMPEMASLVGKTVLIAGATSASGEILARALVSAGARVVATGRSEEKLQSLADAVAGVETHRVDLSDEQAVTTFAQQLHRDTTLDGVVHLVGGWKGGGGLAGQSEEDFRFLENSLTALRFVTRAFNDDLLASATGRLAIISSTQVKRPLAGGANYVTVKAASEAWTRAVAQGFAKAARDSETPLTSAATVYRVKGLAGLEEAFATRYVESFDAEATSLNDQIVTIETEQA